jgi:hypothetical protein
MGWTTTHKQKGQSIENFFKDQWDGEFFTVLKCKTYNLREVYMACEARPKDKAPYVFGMVVLISFMPKSSYNFGYKDMDESMGPNYYNCPTEILDMLSVTDSEYANAWRARCRDIIARKGERK